MNSRRQFFKKAIKFIAGMGLFFSPIYASVRTVYAKAKRIIVPKDTTMGSLINENPANLDTRNLEVIPLKEFETMGVTDHKVNIAEWRLEVTGKVKKPLHLTYKQITGLPAIEREILLICPGFFSNHGRWKGVSIMELLNLAQAEEGITHITLRGPDSGYEKADRFPLKDIASHKVFLAYEVNGQTLPQKHGFPLRAVAEDYYGSNWTKYVYTVEAEKDK
jgi:sulfoxide reductase catalytic subunit YedY